MSEKKKGYLGRVFEKYSSRTKDINSVVGEMYKDAYCFRDSEMSDKFGGGKIGKVSSALFMTVATPAMPGAYIGINIVAMQECFAETSSEIKEERTEAEKQKKKNNYDIM